jgi:hypothetical protein
MKNPLKFRVVERQPIHDFRDAVCGWKVWDIRYYATEAMAHRAAHDLHGLEYENGGDGYYEVETLEGKRVYPAALPTILDTDEVIPF